jgi:hypothetical protein
MKNKLDSRSIVLKNFLILLGYDITIEEAQKYLKKKSRAVDEIIKKCNCEQIRPQVTQIIYGN